MNDVEAARMIATDAEDAWRRFIALWPYDPIAFRRAAAFAEFERLTEAEREEAIRSARIFAKAWRAGGRRGSPDARVWIRARGWEAADNLSLTTAPAKGHGTNERHRH
jgi:hypothetical protein